jgi:hypothetical protein
VLLEFSDDEKNREAKKHRQKQRAKMEAAKRAQEAQERLDKMVNDRGTVLCFEEKKHFVYNWTP